MVHLLDLPIELLTQIVAFAGTVVIDRKALEAWDTEDCALGKNCTDCEAGSDENEESEESEKSDKGEKDSEKRIIRPSVFRGGVPDLLNLCLVSRQMRLIAQPILLKNVGDCSFSGRMHRTATATRVLYDRPELAKHVHHYGLTEYLGYPPATPPGVKLKDSAAKDVEFFTRAIRDLKLGEQEDAWVKAMEKVDISVFVALFVKQTPNIRSMNLPGGRFHTKPFNRLLDHSGSFLSQLEKIHVEGEEAYPYDIGTYDQILCLPRLRKVGFEYGDLLNEDFPDDDWTPGSLAAQEFEFHFCHIDAAAIKKLLRACKEVKAFKYYTFTLHPEERRFPETSVPEFNAAQLHQALLPHKETLRQLELEFSRELEPWSFGDLEASLSDLPKFDSFRDFTALETIVTQYSLLELHPKFPSSLKKLKITDCNFPIREMVERIAEDCRNGLYPNLTSCKFITTDLIKVATEPGTAFTLTAKIKAEIESLVELFKGTKVDLGITNYEYGPSETDEDEDYDDDDDYDEDDDFYDQYPPGPGALGPGNLFHMVMQQAMQDPDFAHLFPGAGAESEASWVTDDEEDEEGSDDEAGPEHEH